MPGSLRPATSLQLVDAILGADVRLTLVERPITILDRARIGADRARDGGAAGLMKAAAGVARRARLVSGFYPPQPDRNRSRGIRKKALLKKGRCLAHAGRWTAIGQL